MKATSLFVLVKWFFLEKEKEKQRKRPRLQRSSQLISANNPQELRKAVCVTAWYPKLQTHSPQKDGHLWSQVLQNMDFSAGAVNQCGWSRALELPSLFPVMWLLSHDVALNGEVAFEAWKEAAVKQSLGR